MFFNIIQANNSPTIPDLLSLSFKFKVSAVVLPLLLLSLEGDILLIQTRSEGQLILDLLSILALISYGSTVPRFGVIGKLIRNWAITGNLANTLFTIYTSIKH